MNVKKILISVAVLYGMTILLFLNYNHNISKKYDNQIKVLEARNIEINNSLDEKQKDLEYYQNKYGKYERLDGLKIKINDYKEKINGLEIEKVGLENDLHQLISE